MATVRFSALGNPTVIVTAIVYGLLLRIAEAAGLFGMLLRILVTLSLWRYGYSVLRNVANGWNHFPPPDIESTNPFGQFAVVLHSFLFSSLIYLLATTPLVDGFLRWALLLFVLGVFPASAAIMAMTRNAAAAFSPVAIATLMKELRADYLKLYAVSVALGLLTTYAGSAGWGFGIVADMVSVWTSLALFLATGVTLRAHRFELDLLEGLDDAEERNERYRQVEWQRSLDRAYASVRSGLPAQAYRTIKELIASEGDSLDIYQWTFNGMLAWDEQHHAALLGERFARRLWDEGRKVDALDLAQRCRKLSPQFAPPAAFTAELAEYARSIGRHRLADELGAAAAAPPPR
ncbi:MAG TPA: hypothetical protein VIQ99_08855 [Gammaproteobacteria bacterium]